MVVELEDIALDASGHLVHFYDCESDLVETVGRYLIRAAEAGAAGVVIATEGHRRAFEAELDAAGVDPSKGGFTGTLTLLDAAATLARFMSDGRIDRDAFREVIGSVVRQAGDMGRPVCAYGEMVALLWDAGNVLAAIELEELWNELGRERQFTLLCGYRSESVNEAEHEDALQQICLLHSSVLQAVRGDGLDARSSAGAEVSPEFPADPTAARAARQFISDRLAHSGVGSRLLDDARLVVTELATNAIVHACSPFTVLAHVHDSGVRVSVSDNSPIRPAVRANDPLAVTGRGLQLVQALSSDWGVEVTADGKTVWADLRA